MKAVDIEELYSELLDETSETIKIGSLEYLPSYVLKRVDPIAFKTGAWEYADALLSDDVLTEMDGELYWKEDVR